MLWLACAWALAPAQAQTQPAPADVSAWQAQAERQGLHRSGIWQALLHLRDGQPQILDDSFLLSLPQFSPQRELDATLAQLYGPPSAQAVCRFPARYLWLQRSLNLPPLSLAHCQTLQEFIARAPVERISLVFASENLSQPSSMMGHLFLKVAGQRRDGSEAAHAIAFFTDAATLNLPKLFYDSMVVGKQGYFVLTPFQDEVQLYAVDEQRSLWEYELQLDAFSRQLMQAHMHELRQTRITYFFQDYNCATLVKHIVALAAPQMLDGREWWTTPKGVVQRAQEAGLVAGSTVTTPSRWHVRALREGLLASQVNAAREQVEQRTVPEAATTATDVQQGFLTLELARAYNSHLLEQKRIARSDWQAYATQLDEVRQRRYAGLGLQTDARKNPVNAPPERQISLGWQRSGGAQHLRLGLQPVSHALVDDNRQLFSESELRLFDSALLVEAQSGRVRLDHFTLYAVESLLPRESMTGGLSGRFKIGVERQPQLLSPDKKALLIEGAGGYTWRLSDDLDAFALLGGGWGYRQQGYLYAMPSIGMVVREVFDMKTVLRLSQISKPLGQQHSSRELRLSQVKYLDAQHSLLLEWRRTWQQGRSANEGMVVLKRLF
ncbi:MAG: DUF4105 domain-containing protein [Aquabacterium sp.]|uniref:lipoprotein N-acyltransferase Lnb domain-containing protein n=1 Tax=Aquabacterium sp. TaxID=1872578 RepID=UPI001DAEA331|nr:DUF4105 domain-containing protein [Aquabacterium sp.]MBT9609646.1 DUF4105 domain-containing protein [Aquabacterium sp.]